MKVKTNQEKFEILESLPCYGNMYISIPENGYTKFSEGLPVKFYKEDGTDWVGNFELGFSNLKFASKFKNSNNIIIIASGICYVINPERQLKAQKEIELPYFQISK